MSTYSPKLKEIRRAWYLVDAENQVVGRLASKIANLLSGKSKATFSPHLDSGDYVVVVNAAKVVISGKKAKNKKYYRHSGFPGGLKITTFEEMMKKDPPKVIQHAVAGMLAKNRLKDQRLARLKIFAGEEHPYKNKFLAKPDLALRDKSN